MRESKIEKYFTERVEAIGALQRKLAWVNRRSAPDRFVVYKGVSPLVELKATGKKPRPDQVREIKRLRDAGAWVETINSSEEVDRFVELLKAVGDSREIRKKKNA
ncbi:VRR-NUC domain-containing protein [Candidatus Pacearchaeota archaeon]|nr:VRR-NUC domain-containing protein [Candidatus Pacearchaeota archaeon]